jgi:hypothetical protein
MTKQELDKFKRDTEETITRLKGQIDDQAKQIEILKKPVEAPKIIKNIDIPFYPNFKIDRLYLKKIVDFNGAQQTKATSPTGGATIDSQARTAIDTIITLLTNSGITN